MATSHSTAIGGITFGPDEVFGPSTLAAMFGPTLPASLHADRSGSVPVAKVAAHLRRLHQQALADFDAHSEIVVPGTPAALDERDFQPAA